MAPNATTKGGTPGTAGAWGSLSFCCSPLTRSQGTVTGPHQMLRNATDAEVVPENGPYFSRIVKNGFTEPRPTTHRRSEGTTPADARVMRTSEPSFQDAATWSGD